MESESSFGSQKAILAGPQGKHQEQPSFKHLFAFSIWQHYGTLILGLFSALIVGGLKATLAIILGKVFVAITGFGSGSITGEETRRLISSWCVVLTMAGALAWLANFAFMLTWTTFGEEQARHIRTSVFSVMLQKDMAWFDCQENGIASLLIRIQT